MTDRDARESDAGRARHRSFGPPLEALDDLTRRLRVECPWDREQTARTIVPHTVEEAYEVADAVAVGDDAKLLDELGDLLFQVVFLALLLEEREVGDLEDVIRGVHAKLVRRHPHVFGDAEAATAGRVRERWEQIKSEQEGRAGIFHDVPEALPGLLHARKVQRRAAAVGYDWGDLDGPLEKVHEEVAELVEEVRRAGRPPAESEPDPAVAAEMGDALFTLVNLARFLNVDPELAIRATSQRFVTRIEAASALAAEAGVAWSSLDLVEQERWYERAKRSLADGSA
ncbi:MAG: nucleoside triphosphate pyrophosphohydrolase [Gaiella sp.]